MAKANAKVQELAQTIAKILQDGGTLETRTNGQGRVYFTTGLQNFSPFQVRYQGDDGKTYIAQAGGSVCLNLTNVREAGAIQEAAIATIDEQVAKLTPEARQQLAEKLLAGL